MDIYDLKMMGHSGFDTCKIVDSAYYDGNSEEVEGVLFVGDVDDAPECLDDLEITSLDIWFNQKENRIEVTLDVDGVDADVLNELHDWRDEESNSSEYLVRDADTGEVVAHCDDEEEAQSFIDADDGEHNYEIVENA